MGRRNRHRSPQPSSGLLETDRDLSQCLLSRSARASTSSSTASESSATTSSSATPKKQKWYKRKWHKPKLSLNFNKEWIWTSFSAGSSAVTGTCENQSGKEDGGNEEWEQLPVYTPPERCTQQLIQRRIDETSKDGRYDWLIEPPSSEPCQEVKGEGSVEPPPYQ